jgi:hypothetical protein
VFVVCFSKVLKILNNSDFFAFINKLGQKQTEKAVTGLVPATAFAGID